MRRSQSCSAPQLHISFVVFRIAVVLLGPQYGFPRWRVGLSWEGVHPSPPSIQARSASKGIRWALPDGTRIPSLAHLRLPPKTVTLLLGRNEIAGPGLVHLAGGKLQTLGLEYNNLDDDTIRHLPQLGTLKKLFLEYCEKLTDTGIRTGVLQGMTHLEELRLRGMQKVTDASLDDLVKFGHLKTISVRSVGITNDGVERMKKGMPETHVFR